MTKRRGKIGNLTPLPYGRAGYDFQSEHAGVGRPGARTGGGFQNRVVQHALARSFKAWSGVYTPRGAAPAVSAGDKGSFGRAPRARPGNVATSCRSCASLSSYVKVSIDTTLERGATFYGARFEFGRAVGMRRGVGESGRRPVGSIIKIKRSWRGAATGPGPGPPHCHSMCDPKNCPLYPLPVG